MIPTVRSHVTLARECNWMAVLLASLVPNRSREWRDRRDAHMAAARAAKRKVH